MYIYIYIYRRMYIILTHINNMITFNIISETTNDLQEL